MVDGTRYGGTTTAACRSQVAMEAMPVGPAAALMDARDGNNIIQNAAERGARCLSERGALANSTAWAAGSGIGARDARPDALTNAGCEDLQCDQLVPLVFK